MSRRLPALLTAILVVCGVLPSMAHALTIDFEGFVHGRVLSGVDGITITADNFVRTFDYAVVFDSEANRTSDRDLEAGWKGLPRWSGGNLEGVTLGNILILQEDAWGCSSGVCLDPDDEGGRPAGTLTFDFDVATPYLGFDLIDVDSTVAENGAITLVDSLGASVTLDFMTVLSGFDIGDNTANRIDPLVAADYQLEDIATARFLMGGSGGIDNIEYAVVVPEPATAVLMGLGLLGLGHAGRRRG